MDSWNLPSFSFPRFVESVGCGSGRGEESSGGGILRLIRIRLATPSLQKKPRSCQANSPQAQIADSISAKRSQFLIFSLNRPRQIARSNSRNAVNFSSACTTKRFPSSRCASAIQIVRPLESTADTQAHRQAVSVDRAEATLGAAARGLVVRADNERARTLAVVADVQGD